LPISDDCIWPIPVGPILVRNALEAAIVISVSLTTKGGRLPTDMPKAVIDGSHLSAGEIFREI
jgi:hypothetical protein